MKPIHLIALFLLIIALSSMDLRTSSAQSVTESRTDSIASASIVLSGWLSIIRGDDQSGTQATTIIYLLSDETHQIIHLRIDESVFIAAGGMQTLQRQHVIVTGQWLDQSEPNAEVRYFQVSSIQRTLDQGHADISSIATPAATSYPWISVLCKFADISAEPRTPAYFQSLYGTAFPGLDHYWREVSYGLANLSGSASTSKWYTLPHPRSYYVYDANADGVEDLNFDRITNDCTGVADADVNYALYQGGINLMFNSTIGPYAFGGYRYLTLDGVSRSWPMTWEPDWGYTNQTVFAHETGHALGLPHSSVLGKPYGTPQGNRWDIMGEGWIDCPAAQHPTYGCLAQHTIAYHKDLLGWIGADKKYVAWPGSEQTIFLERLAVPQTANYLMVQIPIQGSLSHFYTAEMRQKVGYDVKLPAEGVILHDVEVNRSEPAQFIDIDNNNDTGDAGAIWTPGETFSHLANNVSLTVRSTYPTGAEITVRNYPGVCDYFNTSSLDPIWQWVDPLGGASYSLVSGNVRLSVPNGNRDLYMNLNAPRLLQPVIGNFRAKTSVTINQHLSYQGAGILVWQDAQNYIRVERGSDGYGIAMWSRINGNYTGTAIPFTKSTVFLRIDRSGNDFTTWYSENDRDWIQVGAVSFAAASQLQIGPHLINSWQDNPLSADFAYFDVDWCRGNDTPPSPVITAFTPATGSAGTVVTITGNHFTGATTVAFNGLNAAFSIISDTEIKATVPLAATTGFIRVTTPGGIATSSTSFTVQAPAPVITAFTPATGSAGTVVTITGNHFTGATTVAFNGLNAAFSIVSDTEIKATVPLAATTGFIRVTTPGGIATSSTPFTVQPRPAQPTTIHLPLIVTTLPPVPEALSGRWRGTAIQQGSSYSSDIFFDILGSVVTSVHVGILPPGCPLARAHHQENMSIPIRGNAFTLTEHLSYGSASTTLSMTNTFSNMVGAGQATMTIVGYCGPGSYHVSWQDAVKIIDY